MALQFVPFMTFIDPLFWDELGQRKLNDWKLNENPQPITATYSNQDHHSSVTRLSISHEAFLTSAEKNQIEIPIFGTVMPLNTRESFKNLDRKQVLNETAEKIKSSIESLSWIRNPSLLNTFCLTVYPDLKKYIFEYWNCIPALLYPQNVCMKEIPRKLSPHLEARISRYISGRLMQPFLLINEAPFDLSVLLAVDFVWNDNTYLVYPDPSTRENLPGWPLRNLLAALAFCRGKLGSAKFICYRSGSVPSIIMHLSWNADSDWTIAAVGWERPNGILSPSCIDLRCSLDSVKLMQLSSELNLRLIRWRLVPDINLQLFMGMKCLILGAGTLGCNVARALLGWGVNYFTFVDSGRISYSNIMRQSLFTYNDAISMKNWKADVAKNSLKAINPLVDSFACVMKIPMPGHRIQTRERNQTREVVNNLEELIKNHDVTFLLLDSREARWLPTLLAAVNGKLAISVALGFDSFVVIRHGLSEGNKTHKKFEYCDDPNIIPGSELGCYFCSDVTAPGNSSLDRTVDQQCTVTRAGLSYAAAGAAVELLSSVIQHPQMGRAPARINENDESATVLGATPHQIRSFFSKFTQMTPAVKRFERCIACGSAVLDAYRREGFDFVFRVFNYPQVLEMISGLDMLQASATTIDLWEFDDNESISSNGEAHNCSNHS